MVILPNNHKIQFKRTFSWGQRAKSSSRVLHNNDNENDEQMPWKIHISCKAYKMLWNRETGTFCWIKRRWNENSFCCFSHQVIISPALWKFVENAFLVFHAQLKLDTRWFVTGSGSFFVALLQHKYGDWRTKMSINC